MKDFIQPAKGLEISNLAVIAEHLRRDAGHLPAEVKCLAVDGYYPKLKFVKTMRALNLHVVSKLRHDANLRYLYQGSQKPLGAKRKYSASRGATMPQPNSNATFSSRAKLPHKYRVIKHTHLVHECWKAIRIPVKPHMHGKRPGRAFGQGDIAHIADPVAGM